MAEDKDIIGVVLKEFPHGLQIEATHRLRIQSASLQEAEEKPRGPQLQPPNIIKVFLTLRLAFFSAPTVQIAALSADDTRTD